MLPEAPASQDDVEPQHGGSQGSYRHFLIGGLTTPAPRPERRPFQFSHANPLGYLERLPKPLPFDPLRELPPSRRPGLVELTQRSLSASFTRKSHYPSAEMWDALDDAISIMVAMADGVADPNIYLSSLDPGVGKSQSVVHFLSAFMRRSRDYPDVGIIVCLSRINEVENIVREAGNLGLGDFAVLTAEKNKGLNNLGRGSDDRGNARVLFTTQAQVESRCRWAGTFADVEAFHYHGRPRQVRIWDEALMPGRGIVLTSYDISALIKPLSRPYRALADAIEGIYASLLKADAGDLIEVPELAEEYGVGPGAAATAIGSQEAATVMALWSLSGRTAVVRKDYGSLMLTYHNWLPKDIAPVLVLDASSRKGIRSAYEVWDETGGNIEWLKTAAKDYAALNVHVWDRSGGKTSFGDKDKAAEMIEAIAATINAKPNEQWLVIGHKPETIKGIDVEKRVRDRLTFDHHEVIREADPGRNHPIRRVEFTTWGNHTASNAYREATNVILAGTLFYRVADIDAMARSLSNTPPAAGPISPETIEELRIGEHRHNLLQALCRGAVRFCVDGKCPTANAYVIAAEGTGIREALPDIFPGCRVTTWIETPAKAPRKVDKAIRFLIKWFAHHTGELPRSLVRSTIGMKNAANFNKNVRNHRDFKRALQEHGIVEQGLTYIMPDYGFPGRDGYVGG
jgi:hypothetical protein